MKYLLSDGSSTSDRTVYIKDLFKLNLLIRLDEVPYWSGGSDDLIKSIRTSAQEAEIRTILDSIISKLNIQFEQTAISLVGIVISNSVVSINLKINGVEERYDIQR